MKRSGGESLCKDPEISCVGKVKFDSRSLAFGVTERQARSHRSRTAYRCDFCRGWHLGTKTPNLNRKPPRGLDHDD